MKKRILVLGDYIKDVYVEAVTSRLSAEAPIPVFLEDYVQDFPGGAGNLQLNLATLGYIPYLPAGVVNYPVKTRVLVNGVQVFRYDRNDWCTPLPTQQGLIQYYDAIAIADYDKGAIHPGLIEQVQAEREERPLYVTTKGDPTRFMYMRLPPAILFCNAQEYSNYITEYSQFELVIRSCSENGLELVRFGEPFYSLPSYARKVVSVCGAGDSLMAGFIAEHLRSGNPIKAAEYANIAAAIAVGKPYTSTVSCEEIAHYEVDQC